MFRFRPRERGVERDIAESHLRRQSREVNARTRIEKNTILRWYRKLVVWGERREIPPSKTSTAREYARRIVALRPELEATIESITMTFDESFYSSSRLGRTRIRKYVRDVRAVTGS